VRTAIIEAAKHTTMEMEASHHEVAPGQHEIDVKYSEALTMADNVVTYKNMVKSVAAKFGYFASFMPKPISGINGSGMHVHENLYDIKKKKNAFYDEKKEYNLSDVAIHYIGGTLKYAREIAGVIAPTVNSYKRLVPGFEAPVYISWARNNRSALVRIPECRKGKSTSTRIELRCPDPSCNPYLAFAVMLKAGLMGVKEKIKPPDPVEEDVFEFDDAKLKKYYIKTLPGSLKEAIDEMEKGKVVRETFGEETFQKYVSAKKQEWDDYRTSVTDWEVKRYLPIL
jgi:glutamine synthetase